MKEVVWRNVDAAWFEIEIFKVKDIYDPLDDITASKKIGDHWAEEVFTTGDVRDAVSLAEKLITRDDDYNCALIYLCRYNEKPWLSEGRNDADMIDTRVLIGDVLSEETENEF